MKNFITNNKETDNLKKRLSQLISKSDELKFLVGFFYFSGLKELYESLKENSNVVLKILVGLNVDTLNCELIEYSNQEDRKGSLSNEEIYNKFFCSLKKSINFSILFLVSSILCNRSFLSRSISAENFSANGEVEKV